MRVDFRTRWRGCYVGRAGFESYIAADAINKSVSAVNKSITASTENPNVTANVKVLIESVQKVCLATLFLLLARLLTCFRGGVANALGRHVQ